MVIIGFKWNLYYEYKYQQTAKNGHCCHGSAFIDPKLSAAPELETPPMLVQGSIIGTVFLDANANGHLDKGEVGLSGVRLATVTGLVLETDGHGRYHIPDTNIHNARLGQNQLLKVDLYTLPQGAKVISENPRVLRVTNKALNKINFAVVF